MAFFPLSELGLGNLRRVGYKTQSLFAGVHRFHSACYGCLTFCEVFVADKAALPTDLSVFPYLFTRYVHLSLTYLLILSKTRIKNENKNKFKKQRPSFRTGVVSVSGISGRLVSGHRLNPVFPSLGLSARAIISIPEW